MRGCLSLDCIDADSGGTCSDPVSSGEAEPQAGSAPASLLSEEDILREAGAAFSDGINTGLYINSYTTKQRPTLEVSSRRCAAAWSASKTRRRS